MSNTCALKRCACVQVFPSKRNEEKRDNAKLTIAAYLPSLEYVTNMNAIAALRTSRFPAYYTHMDECLCMCDYFWAISRVDQSQYRSA